MKTLKQILNREAYEPVSSGDKKFVEKHKVAKVKKSKPAENDDQFSGGTKPSKTKANANSNGSYAPGPSGNVAEQYIQGRSPAKGGTYKISKPDHPEYNKKFKYVGRSDKGEHFHRFKDNEGKIRAFHASHVKHVAIHEEVDQEELTEGYREKEKEYLNKALGKAKEIVDHLTFMNNWKAPEDNPYASPFYDLKYLFRRIEDLYDDVDNQVDNLQAISSVKKDTK